MKHTRGPSRVFLVAFSIVLLVVLIDTVDGGCSKKFCPEFPPWVDWRTDKAKEHCHRNRLTEEPFRTSLVVIGAILIVLLNALLCHIVCWDETLWSQRTYRMLFSLACNDCITGILLLFGVMTEMESVQEYTTGSPILCKMVIAGLWLCVVTSIYTFNVISVISAG